jgi:hypothetical protein
MQQFIKSFIVADNKPGVVYIYHKLFGGNRYNCDCIHIICDESRLGVNLKGKELYIPITSITEFSCVENEFVVESDRQWIKIII